MENSLKFYVIGVYLICVVAQILLNCALGSRLSAQSDKITHAIYVSHWIDLNETCKRAYLIFVLCSMRPMTIHAGGIFELSLPTFVKVNFDIFLVWVFDSCNKYSQICKAAYSYCNVLRSID